MKLGFKEKFVMMTWIPTAVTYIAGDKTSAAVMLGGNVTGLVLYACRDWIRFNQNVMKIFRKIF